MQSIRFEVTVTAAGEPLIDDHDIATISSALIEAVDALGWEGVEADSVEVPR